MGELLGFVYFVFGGIVTGQMLYAMWEDDAFAVDPGKEPPFVGMLLMALLFWLVWPIVWGVIRARKSTP